MTTKSIAQSILKDRLLYNKETGVFTWIESCPHGRVKAGDVAGCKTNKGYRAIMINGVSYQAHRLAFMYVAGYMPDQVDHRDQDRMNNSWANLRPANNTLNQQNASRRKDNKSGFTGVIWRGERVNKWRAYVTVNGKRLWLGYFADKDDAIAARKEANIKYGFSPNHGAAV